MPPARNAILPVSYALAYTPWVVERVDRLDDFLQRCRRLEQSGPGPLQLSAWLHSLYSVLASSHPGIEPLLLAARPEGDVADALLLPMIVRRKGLVAVVEAADIGSMKLCGPLVRQGLELGVGDAAALWRALREVLRDFDLLRLDGLPRRLPTGRNPWLQLLWAVPAERPSLLVRVPAADGSPLKLQGPAEGLELERCWRHFRCAPEARFVRATSVDEGVRLLRQLVILQHRQHARSTAQVVRPSAGSELHEHFVREHLLEGRGVMTALMSRDEMVAGMLGHFDGRRLTMLRGASGQERWDSCAPRSLLLERTMRALQPLGCREVELDGGETELGAVFGAEQVPLWRSCVPLSLLGQVHALAWKLQVAPHRASAETTPA